MITFENFIAMLQDGQTHRKQFSPERSGIQEGKGSPTFSVPFDKGLLELFRSGTGKQLTWGERFKQYYCFLRTQQDIDQARAWVQQQGNKVFIRNLLSSTTALDFNFVVGNALSKTDCGELEEAAKHHQHNESISRLVKMMADTRASSPYLSRSHIVCGVPAHPSKNFDLPSTLSDHLSRVVGLTDITPYFSFMNQKASAKDVPLSQKWGVWESTGLQYSGPSLADRDVILIDDKYQSGTTMHFVASKLLQANVRHVHGLVAVKTLRDSDNIDVVDD